MSDYAVWTTKNGRLIHLQNMDLVHIWNTMMMLRRKNEKGVLSCGCWDPCGCYAVADDQRINNERWIKAFQAELIRRGVPPEPLWDVLEKANAEYEAK